ncbi:MAG: hypothetical protein QNJ98_15640 [Planctomycetota bacterium]|nr:hypothetical protein [Planctomycetota bacterium]
MHPLTHVVIGIAALALGAAAFFHANARGGEVFDRPMSQGPRDSGFYFFVMCIGVLFVIAGLYQFPIALKEWRRRLRQRRLDRDGVE